MRNVRYRTGVVAALIGLAGALTPLTAGQAQAADDCTWPWVCLYDQNWYRVGAFQDVTSGWQWLRGARGAHWVVNARRDDVVYLHFADGWETCVNPNNARYYNHAIDGNPIPLDALRISREPRCP
ncbi:hypothetical protein [Nocardia sp. NPDC051832]|uniref:hypothetical protein n=1 Tax=Nocardia sp. NPDC051832 TaxID=3155673 RepID=UPI0034486ABB